MNQTKQINKNLGFNLISLLTNIGVGLFYTPYLVRNLGIVAYGIVPLALIINQYINVFTGSLTSSLTRFYTISLRNNKITEASKYLSSSFVAVSVIVGVLSPLFIILILYIDSVFNIPVQLVEQSRNLFIFTILGFIISLYASLINITLYAYNRLDLINILKILRSTLMVFFTIYFFERFSTNIAYIGYSTFIAELGVLILSIFYFKKTTIVPVRFSIKYFEKFALISVLSMAVWVMIHQIGDTGLYRIDNILVNKFWSTRESGILGAVTQFGTYVMLLISVISSLFGPLILIAYGNNEHEKVKDFALNNSLFVGLVTAIIVGLLSGFSKPILRLWLGEEFVSYYKWFALKQITLPFYAAAGIFAFVFRAWNKVIMPAIITLIIGCINLVASYYICTISKGNENFILIILVVAAFFTLIQSFGINSISFLRVYPDIPKSKIIYIFIKILLFLTFSVFISFCYNYFVEVKTIVQLIKGLLIVGFLILPIGYSIFLNIHQKQLAKNLIINFLQKSRR